MPRSVEKGGGALFHQFTALSDLAKTSKNRGIPRYILIPTDGSQLSQNAIAHGAALVKSINAQVTIPTVSKPFHTFAVEPDMAAIIFAKTGLMRRSK